MIRFVVGDTVRARWSLSVENPEGIIKSIHGDSVGVELFVEFDGHNLNGEISSFKGWYFGVEDLELVKGKQPKFIEDKRYAELFE